MLHSAITRSIYLGVMFMANLLLANLLLPYYFGTLTLMILNASVFSIFSGLGSDGIILHVLVNKKWNIGQALNLTRKAIMLQLVLYIMFQTGSLLYSERTLFSNNQFSFVIPETAFFLGLILTEKFITLFYSMHKATLVNVLLLLSAAIYIIVLFAFKYFEFINADNLLILFCMQSFFQGLLLLLVYSFRNRESVQEISLALILNAFKMSMIIMITNVIQFFAYRMDYYILELYHTDFEVGVFAQSNKMSNLMWIIPNIFALLLIPKFSSFSAFQTRSLFQVIFIKNIGVAIATAIAGYLAFVYVLQADYAIGLNAFYLMLPGYFFWATVIYFGAYFSYLGKFQYNLIGSSFCFVSIIITDFALIPKFGINGAALSNTISYSLTFCIFLIMYKKATGIHLTSFLNFRNADFRELKTYLR